MIWNRPSAAGRPQRRRSAFQAVTEIDPKNPDGWDHIGRAAVQEGDMDRATHRPATGNCAQARSCLHYFYARVLRSDGNYDGAAEELRKVSRLIAGPR